MMLESQARRSMGIPRSRHRRYQARVIIRILFFHGENASSKRQAVGSLSQDIESSPGLVAVF